MPKARPPAPRAGSGRLRGAETVMFWIKTHDSKGRRCTEHRPRAGESLFCLVSAMAPDTQCPIEAQRGRRRVLRAGRTWASDQTRGRSRSVTVLCI